MTELSYGMVKAYGVNIANKNHIAEIVEGQVFVSTTGEKTSAKNVVEQVYANMVH
jgi:hypothetical protein